MRRLLASLISVLLIVSCFGITAFAENQAEISVTDSVGTPGKSVVLPVNISANKGIWGMIFDVHFDPDVFTVDEIRNNAEVFTNGDITIGPADFTEGYVRIVVLPNDIKNNNTKNGTICSIIFNVSKSAELGTYPIEINYEDNAMCNIDSELVTVGSTNGKITLVSEDNIKNVADVTEKTKKTDLGDILADADDGKLVFDENPELNMEDEYQTDSNGQYVTDENGENITVKKPQNTTSVSAQDSTTASEEVEENSENTGLEGGLVIYIIIGALILGGIIALVIILVKKKK